LLVLAFVGGLFGLPIFTVIRLSLSVLAPTDQRRTAFSLDGVGTEASFILGPTLGVLIATTVSTQAALVAVAVATLAVGVAVMVIDPPTRSAPGSPARAEGSQDAVRPPRAAWFGPGLVAVLGVAVGATVVLAGTEVSLVAHLREHGAMQLTGAVLAVWSAGSMIGGLVYGGFNRELSPFWLLMALGLLTVPVGLATSPTALALTILPAAALCAPVIAVTSEKVSRLVPEAARGEALGWHGSALQIGSAVGAPLAGVALDASGAWAGFAAAGTAGAVLALAGLVLVGVFGRRRRSTGSPSPAGSPAPADTIREDRRRAGSLTG
jgi:predicted MFS family arabinose efflux permease